MGTELWRSGVAQPGSGAADAVVFRDLGWVSHPRLRRQDRSRAFCFWQLDPEGVSLWLDVSNGGSGVMLGERTLAAATVVARQGQAGEESIEAVRQFCRRMCAKPRPSPGPVYGSNDWYYAYGNSSQEAILRDADLMASLRPATGPKPFTVIDEGWANREKFPDMKQLAAEIQRRGVRPGIWERPLRAPQGTDIRLADGARRDSVRDPAAARNWPMTRPFRTLCIS